MEDARLSCLTMHNFSPPPLHCVQQSLYLKMANSLTDKPAFGDVDGILLVLLQSEPDKECSFVISALSYIRDRSV